MQDRNPNIVTSGLSRTVSEGGLTVRVQIYRLEHEAEWVLEVVNEARTSIVWDDLFATDVEADAAFSKAVDEEGMRTFLDSAKVIPFKR